MKSERERERESIHGPSTRVISRISTAKLPSTATLRAKAAAKKQIKIKKDREI
jgi:hypothetical protein